MTSTAKNLLRDAECVYAQETTLRRESSQKAKIEEPNATRGSARNSNLLKNNDKELFAPSENVEFDEDAQVYMGRAVSR